MDIAELILHDHHELEHQFALLDEAGDDPAVLEPLWRRLATLLEVHAAAEEEIFYPVLLDVGRGAGGEDGPEAETRDAIGDHNEIRDAIRAADEHPVGSTEWRKSVVDARVANSDHMGEEERGAIADIRQHADLQQRHDLAVAFATFEATHRHGVDRPEEDADTYIDQHS
ncbi:hemerythrin domain-containing protein [uncultured Williamsia sp.]|uniref:hemerythrin domain-containing protein n=1 Tax=uncultured Williamsia sp. TaxID=259311 RepID=UPI00262D6B4D|nr:hemerythrin domain-containing protein [uncultured Williamsia sp.]